MNQRENLLRAVRFETPETIPMIFHINPACWQHYPHDALQELMAAASAALPRLRAPARGSRRHSRPCSGGMHPYPDPWGCVWHTSEDGITGTVTEHPLADWAAFEDYAAPDPDVTDGLWPIDWAQVSPGHRRLPRRRASCCKPASATGTPSSSCATSAATRR